jgi:hypothetical protein
VIAASRPAASEAKAATRTISAVRVREDVLDKDLPFLSGCECGGPVIDVSLSWRGLHPRAKTALHQLQHLAEIE